MANVTFSFSDDVVQDLIQATAALYGMPTDGSVTPTDFCTSHFVLHAKEIIRAWKVQQAAQAAQVSAAAEIDKALAAVEVKVSIE